MKKGGEYNKKYLYGWLAIKEMEVKLKAEGKSISEKEKKNLKNWDIKVIKIKEMKRVMKNENFKIKRIQ